MFSKSKIKPKIIGSAGHTIYSLAITSDQKNLYVGLDHKDIKIFDIQKNKLVGKVSFQIS
jgi:hypothetical protein